MPETLAAELLLLAHDIRGRCRLDPIELECGVAGALLSELHLANRLTAPDGVLAVAGEAPAGDPVLDRVLADVRASSRGRAPQEWVALLRGPDLVERLLAQMADHGQVEIDQHRTLGVFTETRYRVRDIVGLWEAHQRVVAAVTTSSAPDRRTLALGALVTAAGLGKVLLSTSGNWRTLRARMRTLTQDDWAAGAVHATLTSERRGVFV